MEQTSSSVSPFLKRGFSLKALKIILHSPSIATTTSPPPGETTVKEPDATEPETTTLEVQTTDDYDDPANIESPTDNNLEAEMADLRKQYSDMIIVTSFAAALVFFGVIALIVAALLLRKTPALDEHEMAYMRARSLRTSRRQMMRDEARRRSSSDRPTLDEQDEDTEEAEQEKHRSKHKHKHKHKKRKSRDYDD